MVTRRSVVLVSALAVTTSLLASACRKGTPGKLDASTNGADAGASDAASAEDAATAAPVATTAPTTTSTELAALMPPTSAPMPTPFTGTYRCFGGMKLEQAGRIVTSTIHKGTTDTVLACTAGGDVCTGTVREIQTVKGKSPKVTHVKPVTLTRTSSGDIVYVVGASEKKAGKGDQTLCPRR